MADRKLYVQVIGDTRSLERAFGRAAASSKGFAGSLSQSLSGVARSVGLIGAGFGAAGIAVGLKNAVGAASQFEVTMQKIVGLSGVAQSAIAGLSDDVLKLAPAVGRGPQELAEGLQFITSSGIAAGDAMAVLGVSAKASAAGLGETKTVADAVTSVMNAYGANVVSAASATDTLVATVREGKGEADEFAGVIGNVVSIASQLGVSFNDVGAALAAMTRLGTDSATAATQLQQVFSNLVKVGPKQEKAFEAVGLSAEKLRKELKDQGLLATLRTIQTAFKGDIPGLANAFSDIRALRGVLALIGSQAKQTEGIFKRMVDSTGSLKTAFGAISQTTSQQFARLNAAIDATQITIGAALAPAAEKAAKAITAWLSVSENQEKVQRGVADAVRNVSAVVRGAVGAFKNLRDVIQPVVDSMGGLGNATKLLLAVLVASKVAAFGSAVTGLGTAAGATTARVNLLRASLARLAAIGVITVGLEVILNRDAISKKFNEITDSLPGPKGLTVDLDKLDLSGLQKFRKQVQGMGGDSKKLVAAVDKAIRKLLNLNQAASQGLTAASKIEGFRTPKKTKPAKPDDRTDVFDSASVISDQVVLSAEEQAKLAKKRASRIKKARLAQRQAFDEAFEKIGITFDRADARNQFKQQLSILAEEREAVLKQISVEGHTADLERKLLTITQSKFEVRKDIRDAAKEKIQRQQFAALGLSATGEQRVPGTENLKKQLEQLTARLGPDIAPKIAAQLARISKVLTDPIHKARDETRKAIVEMFETIRGTFDKQSKGPLTRNSVFQANKIIEGLGLTPDMERIIRQRVNAFNNADVKMPRLNGAATGSTAQSRIVVENHNVVQLDSDVVSRYVTRSQQKTRRRNPVQKRGPNRGI